ncbi:beta-ketoacyl synthase chain length factor [Chitinibacter sp. S2-10]|uniref:beta-ketoacyl synthase chain length factor n=1 Tax=Chitinibacter sp. S2-10 TaxID=3373597 RepID=UPI003977B76F
MQSTFWSISLHLASLALWQPHVQSAPNLDFIPALQRRRLSPLTKNCLQLAHSSQPAEQTMQCVFASRHGEIQQTVDMLKALAQGEPLSPAAFSHSVHNASQGLWSIFEQQTGECSAIAAGLDSLPMALLEAATLLADHPSQPVLVIVADEALPDCFQTDRMKIDDEPFALACVITADTPNLQLTAIAHTTASVHPALAFNAWWHSDSDALITIGERNNWEWQRR